MHAQRRVFSFNWELTGLWANLVYVILQNFSNNILGTHSDFYEVEPETHRNADYDAYVEIILYQLGYSEEAG